MMKNKQKTTTKTATTMNDSLRLASSRLFQMNRTHLFLLAILSRLLLLFYSYVHESFDTEFKYTDIDYTIFSDGAVHMARGGSPFDRDTYRYSPILAFLMIPNGWFHPFGKILFIGIDFLNAWLIYLLTPRVLTDRSRYAMLFLLNPSTMIISTRGSAESVICFLVLATLYLLHRKNLILAAIVYGVSVHFKIYPIIFAPTIYLYLTSEKEKHSLLSLLLPNKNKISFGVISILSLIVPSAISFHLYGQKYLDEAWLYHFYRQDLQHNFSPAFYLLKSFPATYHQLISLLYFLPQFALIVYIAFAFTYPWKETRKNPVNPLHIALFLQTFVFVTWNKVITAQYFEWYITLLPLVIPAMQLQPMSWANNFIIWSIAFLQWVLPAYLYEFHQLPIFDWLGFSSVLFVILHSVVIYNFYKCF